MVFATLVRHQHRVAIQYHMTGWSNDKKIGLYFLDFLREVTLAHSDLYTYIEN